MPVATPTASATSPPPPATSSSTAAARGPRLAHAWLSDVAAKRITVATVRVSRAVPPTSGYAIWARTVAAASATTARPLSRTSRRQRQPHPQDGERARVAREEVVPEQVDEADRPVEPPRAGVALRRGQQHGRLPQPF